jgi:hypothetical protein
VGKRLVTYPEYRLSDMPQAINQGSFPQLLN